MGNETFYGDDHSSSSETQGQIVGRVKVGTAERKVGEEKSSPFALDFLQFAHIFFARSDFRSPHYLPGVSEDDHSELQDAKCVEPRQNLFKEIFNVQYIYL